jgi:hypothetical protein
MKLRDLDDATKERRHIENNNVNPTLSEVVGDSNKCHSKFISQTLQFEETISNIKYSHCSVCQQGKLNLVIKDGICCRCENQKGKYLFCHENKTLRG